MISILNLLSEQEVFIYKGMVRLTYVEGQNVTDIEDIIRGIEGVTIVRSSGDDEVNNRVIFEIKIRSFKLGEDAGYNEFIKVRDTAIKNPGIERFEIATKTIERIR